MPNLERLIVSSKNNSRNIFKPNRESPVPETEKNQSNEYDKNKSKKISKLQSLAKPM